jgi:hypothetical protein
VVPRIPPTRAIDDRAAVASFVLWHRHSAEECGPAYAAWKGFASPLRHQPVLASCAHGGHRLLWTVEAGGPDEALQLLPEFVAARTEVIEVRQTAVP